MSDFNNQNEERYNVFGASNERQKQRTQERQSNIDRYQVYVSDDQYDILNGLISQSDDPVEIENESYRVANALKYSEMYGIDIADAYRDLDNLNAANFGEGAFNTPKDAFCAVVDSFTQGVKQMERNSVGKKIREAEELGNDRYAEELYQTIAGIDEEIAGLQDTQSRNIITTMFKYGAQSLPYTGAAVVTSAVGGLLGGGIGAVVLGTMSSYEAMRGEEYLQLREDGASVETAGRIADCSALVQGVVETSLGTVAGYAGKAAGANPIAKSASNKIAKNMFSRMYYGGAWKKAAAIAGNLGVHTLVEANEEGLEEVIQEIVSSGGRALAAELEGYGVDGLTASEVAKNAWESYKGGFLGALVLGAPNTFIDSKATIQDFKDFNSAAQNIDSKEAFIKETADSPVLDGMSEETKLKAQEEVYDKFEPQRNKKAEERKAMELDRAEVMDTSDNVEETITDESGRVVRDEEYRNEEGGLNYEEKLYDTNEDGSTENLFIVKGKGNHEYGRIMYREDTDGNVTINDFKMSATRENLRQEVYTDFAEKMAGKNIEWETRGKTAASVRDLLAENNIRGKNNGLNYFADKNEVQNQKTRMSWDRQIREAIPSMDAEQRSTGIALVESFANKHGQSIADYDMEIFNGKLFIDKASKEAYESALNQGMNPENIGGYVDIDELGKSTKGIIYAAKKGDATTFVHENAHIFRRLLTADEMAQAEKLFNVTDHNWTRQNEEDFSYALQGYAFEGKAVGEAEPLFRKLAQALVRVYNSLKGKIDFSPELSDFIEGLFSDPTTALAQAKRAVEQNERASYKQDTKEETATSEDIIADSTMDTSDRVSEAIDTAGDMFYQYIDVAGAMNLDNRTKSMYDRAEAMREAGESLENIRLLTGYSIGPDGVFQYELDDSENEIIDREGVQKAINAAQYMNRAMSNPATNAQNLELLQYAMDKQLELMNTTYDTVGKLYKAGELYTAKPELKNIRVGYVYDNRRIRAVQFEGGIGINLAYVSSNEELKGALVHELQHVIDLKASNINYDGDFWVGLYNAMESVEQNNKEYYADLVDDGGIVQYFLTDPYERNAHSAQRRLNLSKAERRAYKPTDVVNNNYLFQSQNTDDNGMLRIKHGLTRVNAIADYLEERLNSWGYTTKRDASDMSNSQYITITNYSEMTGNESKYNVDEVKLRISDHDLPPSYDGLHGYEDYDIRSGKKNTNRAGVSGNATDYDVVLQNLWNELKEKPKNDYVDISDLPEWARNIGDTYEAFKASGRVPSLILDIVRGSNWSKNKKPTKAQQYERLKKMLATSTVGNSLTDIISTYDGFEDNIRTAKEIEAKYTDNTSILFQDMQNDREKATFADAWDKSNVSPEEWLEDFDNDYAEGTTYVWTRVPGLVTKVVKDFGYDGIQDDGGKFHENKHNVYIPFNSYQVKSAYENRGTFDPTKKNILFQTVYHGSPYVIRRQGGQEIRGEKLGFDHSKMGTGEGAQAYGWGTYVTQVEGIAEHYSTIASTTEKIMSKKRVNAFVKYCEDHGFPYISESFIQSDLLYRYDWDGSKEGLIGWLNQAIWNENIDKEDLLNTVFDGVNFEQNKSNIYTLDIPDDGPQYLQWDKDIDASEIGNKLYNHLIDNDTDGSYKGSSVKYLKDELKEVFGNELDGSQIYRNIQAYLGSDKEASLFLYDNGYTGISYPANNLRGGREDGARNFVIFNEEDIKVTDWHAKDANGNVLFQYMQNELDDDTLREASQFDSWEEWYEFAKVMDTDGIITGEWDNVAEQEWFKSAWESSQKIYNPEQNVDPEEEARKDRDFIELIKKPGYLEDFLERAKYFINSELEQPADEAEAKEFEKLNESKRFAANVMTGPVHYANDLDDTQKKKLLSMIEGSPREYRAIYAEVFNDSTLSVPEGYEYTVDTSTAPEDMQMELDNMTPAQRREAMKAIEDEAIRSQIESGSLPMDETLDRYVKVVNEENRKLKKEIDRLNAEYREDLKNISNAQKKALLEEYNRLQDLAADFQSRNIKGNSRISSGLSAGAMATSNVVDDSENGTYNTVMDRIASLKKMFAGERDASAMVAKADERAKQKVLQNKKKAEAEALKEMKKLRTNAIKRMVRKVSFNNVNYDEAKKIIAIQDFIDHWVRTGVNLWLGETEVTASEIYQKFATDSDFRDEVKKALLDKKAGERGLRVLRNLNEAMLDDEGRTFNQWTTKEKNDLIEVLGMNDQVIRLNLDSLATGRKQDIHNFLDKDGRITEECMQNVYSALPKDVIARIRYVPMKKWTLEQAEELAKIIDGIYEEGKLVKAGREQLRRDRYEEIRKRIQDTVKDTGITFGPNDTPEDIKKNREKIEKILGLRTQAKGTSASASEKKSMREKFMAADRGTGNVRRFSRVMDNWSEGVFTDTLCFREYMAYDEEMKAINERSRHVQKYMADNGITMDKLMEQHTFHGLMDGENITLTTDELLYVYIAAQDDLSKEAVMYGNFTTAEEKESVKQHEAKYADKEAIKWFKGNAASRFGQVLARATNLIEQNKDLAGLVEVIENDYEKQYERLNRVSIDVFNMPVNRVEAYVPLYRLEQTGDTNEQQVAKDILADTTGAPSSYVNRGMTKNRVEIGPTNQKPVQMGLFKTWADSMQKTEHFVAYGELIRDLNAIYTSQAASATREAISKRYGQDANNYIKEYINELANPNKGQAKSSLDTLVHVMRGQTAPAYLAWKTSGIIKQLCTSPWPFMAYVTPAEYLVSVGEFITDWNKMNDFVKNRSVFMANRTIDPIIDLIKEAQNKADNKTKAALANFNKMGMQGLEMADWVSVAPGWYAAYKQKYAEIEKAQKNMDPMKDGYMDSEAIETEAIAYADDVVRLTQPSGRSADIAPLFKNSAEIAKVLLQFQTSLNVIYQNIRFDLPYQIKNKQWKQAVGAVIGYTAAGILVNAVVSGVFVTGDGSDDDPEDKLKRAVFYATTQFTDSVPVVGQTLTNTVQKLLTGEGQYSNSTLFPVVDTLTKTVSDISKDNYGKAASDFGQGVAYTLGLPVSGIKELLRMFGIGDNEEGIDFKPEALWGRR